MIGGGQILPAYLQKNQQDQVLILQQLGALKNSVNLLLTGVAACQARYPFFFFLFLLTYSTSNSLSRLPMQLFNTTASNEAPLMYPTDVVAAPYATTKKKIAELTSRLNLIII